MFEYFTPKIILHLDNEFPFGFKILIKFIFFINF
jgi:hypothetical protein